MTDFNIEDLKCCGNCMFYDLGDYVGEFDCCNIDSEFYRRDDSLVDRKSHDECCQVWKWDLQDKNRRL